MFWTYLCAIYGKWIAVIGTISLLLGFAPLFAKKCKLISYFKVPVIAISCIFLFYSGYDVWNDNMKQLSDLHKEMEKPHFEFYPGLAFVGKRPNDDNNIYILLNCGVSNKWGSKSSIIGWTMKLITKQGKILNGMIIPNVPSDRQVTIKLKDGTFIASPSNYLPDITLSHIDSGDTRAGWVWASFPIKSSEFETHLPANLYVGYVDAYSEQLIENEMQLDSTTLGNKVMSINEVISKDYIKTDKTVKNMR
jgi:hypothetical protein